MLLPLFRNKIRHQHFINPLKFLRGAYNRPYTSGYSIPVMATGEEAGLQLKDVINKLGSFAPQTLAESWDNVGLLVEPITKKNVKKILLTNDLTEDVMDEALHVGADLILSYHPPIFSPLKSITGRTWKERIIATCLENRIAVYSPHTSFDAISGGVNDWLASAFDNDSVTPLTYSYTTDNRVKPFLVEITSPVSNPSRANSLLQQIQIKAEKVQGEQLTGEISEAGNCIKLTVPCSKSSIPLLAEIFHAHVTDQDQEIFRISRCEDVPLPGIGMGRLCCLRNQLDVLTVVELVKKLTKLQHVRLALARHRNIKSPVSKIALCAGSGSSVLRGVKADLYLTGEMGHHEVLDAVHKGIHVILCDHSNTERGFLKVFAEKLSKEILDGRTEVVMSQVDRDPLQIV